MTRPPTDWTPRIAIGRPPTGRDHEFAVDPPSYLVEALAEALERRGYVRTYGTIEPGTFDVRWLRGQLWYCWHGRAA